jgi:hypothetical protein
LDDNVNIEILQALPDTPPKRRGGKRVGAGRPALVRENNERIAQGLAPIPLKPPKPRKYKSNAVLPVSKKARSQEILAEMLGKKSKYIVQKVLDKALDDEDEDQMACLKLVMDRVLPADYLAKAKGKSNQISITISGVGETTVIGQDESIDSEDIQDVEFEEVDDDA